MTIVSATTDRLIESYLVNLDCPRALSILIMFRNKEHRQIVELEANPLDYGNVKDFRDAYLATKFLSKAPFLSTEIDRKGVALEKFLASEVSCGEITSKTIENASIKYWHFEWVRNSAIRKIDRILGSFSCDEFFDSANWGPGVTLNLKRDTSSTNKFRSENGMTQHLYSFMGGLIATAYPTWDLTKIKLQGGSKVVTVPKNSKTDRTIAIEPGLNLWFQKSMGTMIRRRLRRVGLNLNSQRRNQQLAKLSSLTGHLATVDFSAASDSISIATVEDLIPPRWYTLMNLLRSKFGSLDGRQFIYKKFSSMGNGFTFELETLIFYALALSTVEYLGLDEKDVSVYGDDVILPTHAYQLYREVCRIYGFTVNDQKSYYSGHFRESCGSHYYSGIDCKPYYLKEVVKGEVSIYKIHNSLSRQASSGNTFGRDSRQLEACSFLRGLVRNPCLISDGYGDGGFIVDFDEATPSKARHGIEGYYAKTLLTVPIGYYSDDHALLLARLKGRSVDLGVGNDTFVRNRIRYLRKRILIRQWAYLGPWI